MPIEFPKQPANQNEEKIEVPEELIDAMREEDRGRDIYEKGRMNRLAKLAEEFLAAAENEEDFDKRFEAMREQFISWGFEYDSLDHVVREMLLTITKRRLFPSKKK